MTISHWGAASLIKSDLDKPHGFQAVIAVSQIDWAEH